MRAFLAEGARVAVPFRKEGELERLRAGLSAERAEVLSGTRLDLTDESAVEAFAASVAEDRQGLDILVSAWSQTQRTGFDQAGGDKPRPYPSGGERSPRWFMRSPR